MASIFDSGNRIRITQVKDLTSITIEARNERYHTANDLLTKLARRLSPEADRVAKYWADRLATTAAGYAPRSAQTGSNSRSGTPMSESLRVSKQGFARYSVYVDHPAAQYVLGGTSPHIIRAGALGATGTVNRTQRALNRINRALDVESQFLPGAGQRTNPRTGKVRAKLSTRELTRRRVAAINTSVLNRKRAQVERTRNRALHAKGAQMLAFPWEGAIDPETGARGGWSQRVGGRYARNMFVGPLVHHPGTRANNFLLRARARIAPGFVRDLRRIFEG